MIDIRYIDIIRKVEFFIIKILELFYELNKGSLGVFYIVLTVWTGISFLVENDQYTIYHKLKARRLDLLTFFPSNDEKTFLSPYGDTTLWWANIIYFILTTCFWNHFNFTSLMTRFQVKRLSR